VKANEDARKKLNGSREHERLREGGERLVDQLLAEPGNLHFLFRMELHEEPWRAVG
jgi:hypothetical protein